MENHESHTARRVAIAAAILATLILAACGSEDSASVDPGSAVEAPSFERALASAPPKLDALYADGGQVLPGGTDAFDARLAELRGYPVVVNVWASWCGPCRAELPYLQSQAAQHLDEIAFVGVNSNDSDEAAATFLSDHPMPYPSFSDPDYDVAGSIDPRVIGQPDTIFLDRDGKVVHVQTGGYPSEAALAADIERYALST